MVDLNIKPSRQASGLEIYNNIINQGKLSQNLQNFVKLHRFANKNLNKPPKNYKKAKTTKPLGNITHEVQQTESLFKYPHHMHEESNTFRLEHAYYITPTTVISFIASDFVSLGFVAQYRE